MVDYRECLCPHCNEPLSDRDAIAVCPDCGAPQHRSCFLEHGECAYSEKHAEGFEWQNSLSSALENQGEFLNACPSCGQKNLQGGSFCNHCGCRLPKGGADPSTFSCPACQRKIREGSTYCNYCGTPIGKVPASGNARRQQGGEEWPAPADFSNAGDYYEAVMESVMKEKEFDGIPVNDWVTYIGQNSEYYLGSFKMQNQSGRKTALTFSALLVPVFYFLYRKVWLFAAIALVSGAILFTPGTLLALHQFNFIVLANVAWWENISRYIFFFHITLKMLWGLYAVHLYRSVSAKRIHLLKQSSADEKEFYVRLEHISGPSRFSVLLFGLFLAGGVLLGSAVFHIPLW